MQHHTLPAFEITPFDVRRRASIVVADPVAYGLGMARGKNANKTLLQAHFPRVANILIFAQWWRRETCESLQFQYTAKKISLFCLQSDVWRWN
jgi:hypothetical protein